MQICCADCSHPYPETGLPYLCPQCGGLFDFDGPLEVNLTQINTELPGIWRYRNTFALFDGAPIMYLGEGKYTAVVAGCEWAENWREGGRPEPKRVI